MSIKVFRVIIWSGLILGLSVFAYLKIIPGGVISYYNDFRDQNYFLGKLSPEERVKSTDRILPNQIIGNPVYFSLFTPRKFDSAEMKIRYRFLPEDKPLTFRAGILVDKTIWRYALQTVENPRIEALASVWSTVREGDNLLLQREKKFASIEEFIGQLPPRDQIALHDYHIQDDFQLLDYHSGSGFILPTPIRGAYQFFTYIKDEDMDFHFDWLDLNKNKDADHISINIFSNDRLIYVKEWKDEGLPQDNGIALERNGEEVLIPGLPEGAYKIEVKSNDDIITRKIASPQSKIAFINKIWLSDGIRPTLMHTNSRVLFGQTVNPGALGLVSFGRSQMDLRKTFTQYRAESDEKINQISISKSDVQLAGKGVFSFEAEQMIDPTFKNVDDDLDADKEGINYILAKYAPIQTGSWREASISLDLAGAYREKGRYSMILSIPNLGAEGSSSTVLEIDSLRVALKGDSLWQMILNTMERIRKIL